MTTTITTTHFNKTIKEIINSLEWYWTTHSIQIDPQYSDNLPYLSITKSSFQQALYTILEATLVGIENCELLVSTRYENQFLILNWLVKDSSQWQQFSKNIKAEVEEIASGTSEDKMRMETIKYCFEQTQGKLKYSTQEHIPSAELAFWIPTIDPSIKLAKVAQEASLAKRKSKKTMEIGERILVIDDEPLNCELITRFLENENYKIQTLMDPTDVYNVVREFKPDVILLDIMLPGGNNGYEICEKLRQTYDKSSLPIIMVTALDKLPYIVEGFDAGANDYLTKPFKKEQLQCRIAVWLEVVQLRKETQRFREQEHKKEEEWRNLIAEIMNMSLKIWENIKGTGKVEFAEESNIWHVYLDQGVFRTRTLDKYFAVDTIPNRPRWNAVLKSGDLALKIADADSHDSKVLKELMRRLKLLLKIEPNL